MKNNKTTITLISILTVLLVFSVSFLLIYINKVYKPSVANTEENHNNSNGKIDNNASAGYFESESEHHSDDYDTVVEFSDVYDENNSNQITENSDLNNDGYSSEDSTDSNEDVGSTDVVEDNDNEGTTTPSDQSENETPDAPIVF